MVDVGVRQDFFAKRYNLYAVWISTRASIKRAAGRLDMNCMPDVTQSKAIGLEILGLSENDANKVSQIIAEKIKAQANY